MSIKKKPVTPAQEPEVTAEVTTEATPTETAPTETVMTEITPNEASITETSPNETTPTEALVVNEPQKVIIAAEDIIVNMQPDVSQLDIETLKQEVIHFKTTAEISIYEMGVRLVELKNRLPHGDFQFWIKKHLDISPRTAQCYMQISEEFGNAQALAHLGFTKAQMLLALPDPEKRQEFLSKTFDVSGEAKSVYEISTRAFNKHVQDYKNSGEIQSDKATKKHDIVDNIYSKMKSFEEFINDIVAEIPKVKDEKSKATYFDYFTSLRVLCERTLETLSEN